MKNFTIATAVAAGLSAAVLGLAAPAIAAPSGANAQDTISSRETQGNRVIVNRQSSTPLSEASVVSVQRGPVMRQVVPDATPNGDGTRSLSSQVIYVTVK